MTPADILQGATALMRREQVKPVPMCPLKRWSITLLNARQHQLTVSDPWVAGCTGFPNQSLGVGRWTCNVQLLGPSPGWIYLLRAPLGPLGIPPADEMEQA